MIAVWILLALVIIALLYAVSLYNRLVTLRNRVDNAWSQVTVQLKRRWDLIPNLVSTVKGYAAHESQTLEAVIQARNAASHVGTDTVAAAAEAENVLSGALRQLFALSESYPDLKANENFNSLQAELSATEDKISYARQFYNDTVMTYNTSIELFPASLLASSLGFSSKTYFEIDQEQTEPVKVEF